ncbi:hypothetical protein QE152_g26137, partial [Popillia japonica]
IHIIDTLLDVLNVLLLAQDRLHTDLPSFSSCYKGCIRSAKKALTASFNPSMVCAARLKTAVLAMPQTAKKALTASFNPSMVCAARLKTAVLAMPQTYAFGDVRSGECEG